jgi:hypothetical protein
MSMRVAARLEGRAGKTSMHRRGSLVPEYPPKTLDLGFVQPVVRQHQASNGKIVDCPKGSAASHWYIFRETPSYMHNKLPHRGRAWRYTGGPCVLGPSTPPASALNGRHYPSWRWLSEHVSTFTAFLFGSDIRQALLACPSSRSNANPGTSDTGRLWSDALQPAQLRNDESQQFTLGLGRKPSRQNLQNKTTAGLRCLFEKPASKPSILLAVKGFLCEPKNAQHRRIVNGWGTKVPCS